jgi:hypothetical protein
MPSGASTSAFGADAPSIIEDRLKYQYGSAGLRGASTTSYFNWKRPEGECYFAP